MARSMVHPYWGNLITCAEIDGSNHQHLRPVFSFAQEMCDYCGRVLLTCEECRSYIECCPCGAHHALECPWPL